MYTIHQVDNRSVWSVDRPSWSHKGYKEDVPPKISLMAGLALFLVPVAIIALSAPFVIVKTIGVAAAVTLIGLAIYAYKLSRRADKMFPPHPEEEPIL